MRPSPERGDWMPLMPLVAIMGYLMGTMSDPSDPWTLTETVAIAIAFHLFERLIRKIHGSA